MLRYALMRLLLWIPSVLVVLLGVYALAYLWRRRSDQADLPARAGRRRL